MDAAVGVACAEDGGEEGVVSGEKCVLCGEPGANEYVEIDEMSDGKKRRGVWAVHTSCKEKLELDDAAARMEQRLLWGHFVLLREKTGQNWIARCPTLPGVYWRKFADFGDPCAVTMMLVDGRLCELVEEMPGEDRPKGWYPVSEEWTEGTEWQAVRPWDE